MNFIFISPAFPDSYYLFCKGLKNNGVNVLGIGDTPYNELKQEVKDSLTEYYKVSSLEDYDQKYRAVAFYIHKYGRIDFIESNNEYWLNSDAALRTDFNIKTGPDNEQIKFFRNKALMKEKYALAGVKTARYHIPSTLEEGKKFIKEVGYPVVVKPVDGVGAAKTYKLKNDDELVNFYKEYDRRYTYIMEEFIKGDLISFDGVVDSKSDVVVATHHVFPTPIMDIVNEQTDTFYYTNKDIPQDLYDAGQATLKAFGAKSRFYHLEFFRLTESKKGLGNVGDLIGLEVNMRVPGGFTPDMINFAYSSNIYQVWADVMVYDENRTLVPEKKQFCASYSRRKNRKYAHTHEDICNKYKDKIKLSRDMPAILADAMGDYFYLVVFDTIEEVNEFNKYLSE